MLLGQTHFPRHYLPNAERPQKLRSLFATPEVRNSTPDGEGKPGHVFFFQIGSKIPDLGQYFQGIQFKLN